MKNSERRIGYFIFIILLGAISGTFIGDVLGSNIKALEFLKKTYEIGINMNPLNLKVLVITFGMDININIMSIIGIVLAIIIYRNY